MKKVKNLRKIFLTLVLSLCLIALGSCGGTKSKADLKITFFNGGYGSDWIHNLADRFTAATGKTVEIVKSEEGPCGAENYIKSGYNLSDIYIGEGIPWKSLVFSGYLEDLTDVYEATVQTSKGEQKIKDFMDQGIVGNFYMQEALKIAEYKPFAMPWTAKPNAMAYNEDILKAIKHNGAPVSEGLIGEDGLWKDVPKTLDDMLAFFEDVKTFNNNSLEKQALNDNHNYVPLGWCGGKNADSLGFLIITWWAEAQGLDVSKIDGEGSFYDFYNFGNVTDSHVGQTFDFNVYKQSGLKNAYNQLANLIIDETTHDYKNSLTNPYNTNLQQLEQLFVASAVNEKPVLTIASSYLENEVRKHKYLDSDRDGVQDVNFKFMNIPKLNAEDENLLYLNFSDSIIVPHKAAHVDTAKEFLIFMSQEESVINFAKDTQGGIRPFDCDVRDENFAYTDFANSLFEVYYNSNHFYEYPANTISLAQVSHIYRYQYPSYMGNVDWLTIHSLLRDPGTKTPGDAICDAVMRGLSESSVANWIYDFKLTDLTDK